MGPVAEGKVNPQLQKRSQGGCFMVAFLAFSFMHAQNPIKEMIPG